MTESEERNPHCSAAGARSPRTAVVWTGFNAFSQIGTRFAAMVMLSWLLPPADFGQFSIALSIAIMLATLAQLGIPTNLICLERVDTKSFAAAVLLALVSSSIVAGFYFIGIRMFFGAFDASIGQVLLLFAPYVILQVLINLLEALSRRIFAFRALALNELLATFAGNLVIAFVLAHQGWGVWALVAGQFASVLMQCVGLLYICRGFIGLRTEMAELRRLASASLSITVAEVANIATVHAQRPLVGAFLGAGAAGLWGRFYQIISIQLTCLVQPLDKLVLPMLSRRRSDAAGRGEIMLLLIEIVTLLTVPASVVTAFAAPFVIPLAFGPAWEGLILPMQIASITFFFRGIDRILLSSARATGHVRSRAIAQLAQLALILAAVPVAALFGLPAVAAAYVGVQLVSLAMMIAVFCAGMGIPLRHVILRMTPGFTLGLAILAIGFPFAVSPELSASRAGLALLALGALAVLAIRFLPVSSGLKEIVRISIAGLGRGDRLFRRSS